MIYSENYLTSSHDTDPRGVVRPSVVLRYMQEAATRSMYVGGPSYTELLSRGFAFILSRVRVCIYKPLGQYEDIAAQSWAVVPEAGSRSAAYNRCHRILRGGETVAEAYSVWALLDMRDGSRRLTRFGDVELNYPSDEPLELPLPVRFRIPAGLEPERVGAHVVTYSELDMNHHFNNTYYPDMFANFIPGVTDGRRISSFAISFLHEAPWNSELAVSAARSENGVYYLRTTLGDTVNAEAQFVLE